MIQSSETLHKKLWTAKESSKHLCVETKKKLLTQKSTTSETILQE